MTGVETVGAAGIAFTVSVAETVVTIGPQVPPPPPVCSTMVIVRALPSSLVFVKGPTIKKPSPVVASAVKDAVSPVAVGVLYVIEYIPSGSNPKTSILAISPSHISAF